MPLPGLGTQCGVAQGAATSPAITSPNPKQEVLWGGGPAPTTLLPTRVGAWTQICPGVLQRPCPSCQSNHRTIHTMFISPEFLVQGTLEQKTCCQFSSQTFARKHRSPTEAGPRHKEGNIRSKRTLSAAGTAPEAQFPVDWTCQEACGLRPSSQEVGDDLPLMIFQSISWDSKMNPWRHCLQCFHVWKCHPGTCQGHASGQVGCAGRGLAPDLTLQPTPLQTAAETGKPTLFLRTPSPN